jgi:ABC-2 type transport system ATP-binding protein
MAVQGEVPPLLRALLDLPLVDLTFAPADLESVFLTYYGGPEATITDAEAAP